MPFEFEPQKIKDVILVKPKVFGDNRGFFLESYKKSDFFDNGISIEFNQDNHSRSSARVLRGLNFQKAPQRRYVRRVRDRRAPIQTKRRGPAGRRNVQRRRQGRQGSAEVVVRRPENDSALRGAGQLCRLFPQSALVGAPRETSTGQRKKKRLRINRPRRRARTERRR